MQTITSLKGYVCGHRSKGRPKRIWIDDLKEDSTLVNLTIQKLEVPLNTEDHGQTPVGRPTVPLHAAASREHYVESS